LEQFEVFTCTLRGGTGPQFPRGTIFLSASPALYFGWRAIGGFVSTWAFDPDNPRYMGALVPGNGEENGDKQPIDIVGSDSCAQPLHLTKCSGVRQISLSATLVERDWCKGGPLSGGDASYIVEHAGPYFTTTHTVCPNTTSGPCATDAPLGLTSQS
jgi:hypothetical protein